MNSEEKPIYRFCPTCGKQHEKPHFGFSKPTECYRCNPPKQYRYCDNCGNDLEWAYDKPTICEVCETCFKYEDKIKELEDKLENYRAAFWLLAEETVWVRRPKEMDYDFISAEIHKGELPALYINCSDTFAYAYADCEKIEFTQAKELLKIGLEKGWPGIVDWVSEQRKINGSKLNEPIPPVERMLEIERQKTDIVQQTKSLLDVWEGFLCITDPPCENCDKCKLRKMIERLEELQRI